MITRKNNQVQGQITDTKSDFSESVTPLYLQSTTNFALRYDSGPAERFKHWL